MSLFKTFNNNNSVGHQVDYKKKQLKHEVRQLETERERLQKSLNEKQQEEISDYLLHDSL